MRPGNCENAFTNVTLNNGMVGGGNGISANEESSEISHHPTRVMKDGISRKSINASGPIQLGVR
jgi:hypothetical protein